MFYILFYSFYTLRDVRGRVNLVRPRGGHIRCIDIVIFRSSPHDRKTLLVRPVLSSVRAGGCVPRTVQGVLTPSFVGAADMWDSYPSGYYSLFLFLCFNVFALLAVCSWGSIGSAPSPAYENTRWTLENLLLLNRSELGYKVTIRGTDVPHPIQGSAGRLWALAADHGEATLSRPGPVKSAH